MQVVHISVFIARSPGAVYAFASNPRNLSRWAAGLASSEIRSDGEQWVADAPFGEVRIKFVEPNELGVMDHQVTLKSGEIFYNPMRVVANAEGSEFIFTLFRQPQMSDAEFADDKKAVEQDLEKLKYILENEENGRN